MLVPEDTPAAAQPKSAPRVLKTKEIVAQSKKLQVNPSLNDFARSCTKDWSPPSPVTPELAALRSLKSEWKRGPDEIPLYEGYNPQKKIMMVDLHDFEIYVSPNANDRNYELVGLDRLVIPRAKKLCFDGFLCLGNTRHYVQAVEIEASSVEGYTIDDNPTIIPYIQSQLACNDTQYDIWYRLNQPSSSYRRFHEPYLWVAQLAKHVIDFLYSRQADSVSLADFRAKFHEWLISRFPRDREFQRWHQACRSCVDFRVTIVRHIDYLYHEAYTLPESEKLTAHRLWKECTPQSLSKARRQELIDEDTIATPHVTNCFKGMYFSKKIKEMSPQDTAKHEQESRKRKLGFAMDHAGPAPTARDQAKLHCRPYRNTEVRVGDVVAIDATEDDKKHWKRTKGEWLAYVQATEPVDANTKRLSVLWLYRPSDTVIDEANYPIVKELFLSDNCNCGDEFLSTDVKGSYKIDWSPSTLDTRKDFLVRQTYITLQAAFVTFNKEHLQCICRKKKKSCVDNLKPGDTVYLTESFNKRDFLEPVIIYGINHPTQHVTVRKFKRLRRDCLDLPGNTRREGIAHNELVLTNEFENVPASHLQRKCHVRFISRNDVLANRVPFPYSRNGAGDFWFLSLGLKSKDGFQHLLVLDKPSDLNEGPDMDSAPSFKELAGLSLFGGGGNFDRGLEEGGGVKFKVIVDVSEPAVSTQRANAQDPSGLEVRCESVDACLKAFLSGEDMELVALLKCIAFIAAGSPCPGFSALQQNKESPASLKNASHVTTICSFADVLRPERGILENVVNMAFNFKESRGQNVLSQLVACLVSMGYQVEQNILDAWNFSSSQHRSRVFLSFTAPGLTPPAAPWHTHSQLWKDTNGRSLGTLPNGQKFGEREYYVTPFCHIPAHELTEDLPNIGNGNNQICVPYPDHCLAKTLNQLDRERIQCIPKHPAGCGYTEAVQCGTMPLHLQLQKIETRKTFKRIKAAGLIPTITTDVNPGDSRNGACLHWNEPRPISLLDARRAQGYLDHEPIIGNLAQQYEIVGNSVDRKVSSALGLALRQAVKTDTERGLAIRERDSSEDADDGFESDKTDSVIDVDVTPRKDRAKRRSSPSEVIPARPQIGNPSVRSRKPASTANRGIPGLVGASTPHPSVANPSHSASQFLTRSSQTFARGAGRLPISSTPSLPNPVTLSLHKKRSIEVGLKDFNDGWVTSNGQRLKFRKRAKNDDVSGTHINLNKHSTNSHDSATSLMNTRHTRHSGLSLEFTPKYWDKRPESEHRG